MPQRVCLFFCSANTGIAHYKVSAQGLARQLRFIYPLLVADRARFIFDLKIAYVFINIGN